MNFFKRLFSGGVPRGSDNDGLYLYIKPDRCDEVIRLRVNLMNDLSFNDDSTGLLARKVVRGTKCFTPVELDLYFNLQRKMTEHTIKGGALVTVEEWKAWEASQASS